MCGIALGEDGEKDKPVYRPKRDASKDEAIRVTEFIKLVTQGSDESFNKDIASYLDVNAFLNFLAVNSLLANLDSFFTLGHNYYLYLNPETNQFVFFPWDVDLSMGNFAFMGSPEQQMDLSLTHPYAGTNRRTERLLTMKNVSDRYRQIVKDVVAKCFAKEQLLSDMEAADKAIKDPIAKDAKSLAARCEGGCGHGEAVGCLMFGRTTPDLRTFADMRLASVESQPAGKSKGFAPTGFGFGGGDFGDGNALARALQEVLDGSKDGKVLQEEMDAGMMRLFRDWDKDKNGSLDPKEIANGLQQLVPESKFNPPGFGPMSEPARDRPKGERP